jgi:hypothetical protein
MEERRARRPEGGAPFKLKGLASVPLRFRATAAASVFPFTGPSGFRMQAIMEG